jgi:hypothetical protein
MKWCLTEGVRIKQRINRSISIHQDARKSLLAGVRIMHKTLPKARNKLRAVNNALRASSHIVL